MLTIFIFREDCTSKVQRSKRISKVRLIAIVPLRPVGLLIFAVVLALLPPLATKTHASELKIYRLNYRDPDDLIEDVRQLLSPYGKASVDNRTRALLVIDNFEAQQRIADFIISHDVLGRRLGGQLLVYAGCGNIEDDVSWENVGGGWQVGYDKANRSRSAPEPDTYNLQDSKFIFYQGAKTRIEVVAVPDLWLLGVLFGTPGNMQRLKGPGKSYLALKIEPGTNGFGVDLQLEVKSRDGTVYHILENTRAAFSLNRGQLVLLRADLSVQKGNTERITMMGGDIGHLCFSLRTDFQ
jgi:Bacterial type II/III secretion system short domain